MRTLALLFLLGLSLAPRASAAQGPAAAAGPATAQPAAAPAGGSQAPASAPRYELVDGSLQVVLADGSRMALPMPCTASCMARGPGRLYLGCEAAGVAVYSLEDPAAPALIGLSAMDGSVKGFHEVGGQLWVVLSRTEARPLDEPARTFVPRTEAATPTVAAASVPAPEPPSPYEPLETETPAVAGSVIETSSGHVVIDLGSEHGLKKKEHVAFFLTHEVDLGAGNSSTEEEILAVGKVSALSEERARVRLGLNERVPAEAGARPTKARLTENRTFPPRVGDVWEMGFMLRPFLPIGAFGFGMLSDASLGLRRASPLHLQLLLEPLGLGYADEGNIIAMAGNFLASYDTLVFEIGLGLGWSAVNKRLVREDYLAEDEEKRGAGSIESSFDEVESGLSIAQLARLGATDGLHISLCNTFLLYDDIFHYGGTVVRVQWPISRRSWGFMRGGGGQAGYGFGEIGLRWLARGNGDRGSVFLTVTAGGAGLAGQVDDTCTERYWDSGQYESQEVPCTRSISYGGPLVGFGAEWRL